MKTIQLLSILIISLVLFSCEKEIITEDFSISLTFQNKIAPSQFGYPCGDLEQYSDYYSLKIWAASFKGKLREKNDANNNVFRNGPDGVYRSLEIHPNELLRIDDIVQIEPGSQVMMTIESWETEFSFWVKNGDVITIDLVKNHLVSISTRGNTGESPFPTPTTIAGKWLNENACMNLNNQKPYYKFNPDGSGIKFLPNCNNSCLQDRFTFFEFSDHCSSVDLHYTAISNYCNEQLQVPENETISYALSTNTLIIEGVEWVKQ